MESNLEWRKSLFSVLQLKGPLVQRKGTACTVEKKHEESSDFLLLTSSTVVSTSDSSQETKLVADRFCSKFPEHTEQHRLEISPVPEHEGFGFIPLQKKPDFYLTLISLSQLRDKGAELSQSSCWSYSFTGNSFQTVHWKYSKEKKTHFIDKVESPNNEFDVSAAPGSPVVYSTQDWGPVVIGIVNCSSNGDPYIMLFTETSLANDDPKATQNGEESKSLGPSSGHDVTDSPIIPGENQTPVIPASNHTKEPQQYNPKDFDDENLLKTLERMKLEADELKKQQYKLREALERNARSKDYRIVDNQGGGNCLFHALSDQLLQVKGDNVPHQTLRKKLVDYLRENPKQANGTDLSSYVHGKTWDSYLNNMQKDGIWGDHLVLHAAVNCYKLPIRVITSHPDDKEHMLHPQTLSTSEEKDCLVLGHITEYHYVSLVPDKDPKAMDSSVPVDLSDLDPKHDFVPITDEVDSPFDPSQHTTQATASTPPPVQCSRDSVDSPNKQFDRTLSKKPIQEEAKVADSRKDSFKPSSLFEEKCEREKPLTIIKGFQDLMTILKINLDPKRELGGDYRSLAGTFDKTMKEIWFLDTKSSPTEILLKDCNPTLKQLCDKLASKEVDRSDVVDEIEEWLKSDGCNCAKCCCLR